MKKFIILRTHTAACRQRHLKWTLPAETLDKAKQILQDKQDACNKTGFNVESDVILSQIDELGLVTGMNAPVLASR